MAKNINGKILGLIIGTCMLQIGANIWNNFGAFSKPSSAPVAPVIAPEPPVDLHQLLNDAAKKHKLEPKLLRAIAMVESSMQPDAINHRTKDYGLLQVNAHTARNMGIKRPEELLDARLNADTGAKILAYMKHRYGQQNGWVCRYNQGTKTVQNETLCEQYLQKLAAAGYDKPWVEYKRIKEKAKCNATHCDLECQSLKIIEALNGPTSTPVEQHLIP